MKTKSVVTLLLLSLIYASVAFGQAPPPQRRRLGILGGLAGAGIGAAIGEDGGDAVPGALIGGAVGLIAGSGIGGAVDERNYQRQAYQNAVAAQQAQAVTMADVISMTQSGLSDAVIINHIRTHGVAQRLNASDLIVLKQQGVSDPVVATMQGIPGPAVVRQAIPVAAPPVIVEEHYYPAPRPTWYYQQHYHRPHPRQYYRGSGFHWGIGISN